MLILGLDTKETANGLRHYEASSTSHPLSFATISFYDGLNESEYPPSVAPSHPLHTHSLLFLYPSSETTFKARREECGNVDAI